MIDFTSVEFSYGSNRLFNKITFQMDRNEYLVISGPTRSGKTTLVQMITGMVVPDTGNVTIDGEDIEIIVESPQGLRNHRRKLGGVGGIYSLLGDRTILENVALAAEISGTPPRLARKRAMEALGRYRLSHLASLFPGSISEVERRTAQLARAEAALKNIIIADSPTDGLDAKAARFINERLASLHLAGAAVLYLTTGEGPQNGPDRYLKLDRGEITS